jgi:branched-chain amino acid transport system permease protein
MFVQLVLQGIATGFVYALVGLGFTLVFRSLNQVIFSQGHVFMAGSFIGYVVASKFGYGPLATLLLTSLLGTAFGVILDRVVFRKLYNVEHMTFVIATIAIGIIIQNIVRVVFPEPVKFPPIFGERTFTIAGAQIAAPYLWVATISTILIAALYCFFNYTKYGQAMRAVASDRVIASAMGVNVKLYISLTIIMSVTIAVIGGILIGPLYFASFEMGGMVGLKAFAAAILGGITSVMGTALGGVSLGILENLAAGYISSEYKDVVSLGVLVLMLLFRPDGLLGTRKLTKV